MCGCLLRVPCWGPGPQSGHVAWLSTEPATLWFVGRHSVHWATPARAELCFSEVSVACPLKFQRELARWGSLRISGGGCHFHVLPTRGRRVTPVAVGTAASWTLSLCAPCESLLFPTTSVLLSFRPITSHPARPGKNLVLSWPFHLFWSFVF